MKTHLASIVEDSLQRAANVALHGSRQARSGQIDHGILGIQRIAQRLVLEAQNAYNSWANWNAINSALGESEVLASTVKHFDLALGPVRDAVMRDCVLTAYRISESVDPTGNSDSTTLCQLAQFLDDDELRAAVCQPQWALDQGHLPDNATEVARQNAKSVGRFRNLVVSDWKQQEPIDLTFKNLRRAVQPVHNRVAHAIAADDIPRASFEAIRRLVTQTLDLSTEMAAVFVGSAPTSTSIIDFADKQAREFWQQAFAAPIANFFHSEELKQSVISNKVE